MRLHGSLAKKCNVQHMDNEMMYKFQHEHSESMADNSHHSPSKGRQLRSGKEQMTERVSSIIQRAFYENGDEMRLTLTRHQMIKEPCEMAQTQSETRMALSEMKMPSSEMTKTPHETTKAHSETTKARAETTEEPLESTKAPSETAKKPPETTKEPPETTKAPSETTKALSETTKAPSETTKAPSETTKAASETTKALSETTKAPSETAKAPSETTKAPSETTKAPSETTKAPSETTKAPSETTKAPSETTKAPSETTKAPSETTKAPSETTKARVTHTNKENNVLQGDKGKTKAQAQAPGVKKKAPIKQKNENLKFYRGEIKSKKWIGGKKIDEMLKWRGNYTELERNHSYIQWLFPIPEASRMNLDSQPLQEHEAEAINLDTELSNKVLKAYTMMLDFYGMRLVSPVTGDVARSANWKDRYKHLNKSIHNRLRISRIIRSLGCLGFKHLQVPWLKLIIHEAVKTRELPALDCTSLPHWIEAVSEKVSREYMWQVYYDLKGFGANVSHESVLEAGPEYEGLEEGSDVDGAVGPGEGVVGKEAAEKEEGTLV